MDETRLVEWITDFVKTTPSEIIRLVVNALEHWDPSQSALHQLNLLTSIHNPATKSKLNLLLDAWSQDYSQLTAQGLALVIQTSLLTLETFRESSIELVWTGPSALFPVRRTDQALLELIDEAKQRLVLVSFAVYKVQAIVDALENALRRHVEVIICLEDAGESQGKVSFSGLKAFSSSLFRLVSFYYWPIENRPHTLDGRFGSLHAKAAVADRAKVFISSANLTEYAMDMNIELGVMVEKTSLGEQIDDLVSELIVQGIFKKMPHQ